MSTNDGQTVLVDRDLVDELAALDIDVLSTSVELHLRSGQATRTAKVTEQYELHVHVVGSSGSGKSNTMAALVLLMGRYDAVRAIVCKAKNKKLVANTLTVANVAALAPMIAPTLGLTVQHGQPVDPTVVTAAVLILKIGLNEFCDGNRPRASTARPQLEAALEFEGVVLRTGSVRREESGNDEEYIRQTQQQMATDADVNVGAPSNAPHLVALVRAGATFVDGLIIEREDQRDAA